MNTNTCICEQMLGHWLKTGQLDPRIKAMDTGAVMEIIDGTPDQKMPPEYRQALLRRT